MDNLLIRKAQRCDCDAAREILDHHALHTFGALRDRPIPQSAFVSWMDKASALGFFIAEVEGVVVGFATLGRLYPHATLKQTGELSYFLHTAYVGRGIGTQLLVRLQQRARELSMTSIVAKVPSTNEPSMHFHTRRGFEVVGRIKCIGTKRGRSFDLVFFQKMLVAQ